jgi:hypothetical protein
VTPESRGSAALWFVAGGLVLAAAGVVFVAMQPPETAPSAPAASAFEPQREPTSIAAPPETAGEIAATAPRREEPRPAPAIAPGPPPQLGEPLDERGVVAPVVLPRSAAVEALGVRGLGPTAILEQNVLALDTAALPGDSHKTREERQLEAFTQAYERSGTRLERMRAKLAEAERIGDMNEAGELRPRVRELEQSRERLAAQVAELRAAVEQQRAAGAGSQPGAGEDPSRQAPPGEPSPAGGR